MTAASHGQRLKSLGLGMVGGDGCQFCRWYVTWRFWWVLVGFLGDGQLTHSYFGEVDEGSEERDGRRTFFPVNSGKCAVSKFILISLM